jgi:hypothetical protein
MTMTNKQIENALYDNYEAYRNGEDDYAIYLHSDAKGRNGNLSKAVIEKYKEIGEALGGDYKIVDQGCYYYVTTRQLAAVGIDDPEVLDYIDQRGAIAREEAERERREAERHQKERELARHLAERLSTHLCETEAKDMAEELLKIVKEAA